MDIPKPQRSSRRLYIIKVLHFLAFLPSLFITPVYLPKVGPMKAGWRNMAVPRKVPKPRGVAGARPELLCGGASPGKAAAAAAAVQADSRAGCG